MSLKTYISKEIFEKMIIDYENGYKISELSEKYHLFEHVIKYRLKKCGVYIKNRDTITHSCSENYFDTIDTKEKSYWLGFLYADGCLTKSSPGGWVVSLHLKESDSGHLEKFRQALQCTNEVKIDNEACALRICNAHMGKQLLAKGLNPRKTFNLNFPDLGVVPAELINSFILGFLDGDGCIAFQLDDERGNTQFAVKVAGTKAMMEGIVNALNLPCKVSQEKKYVNNKKNSWYFSVRGRHQVRRVLDSLYEEAPVYLNRKHEIYRMLVEMDDAGKTNILPKGSQSNNLTANLSLIRQLMKRHDLTFIKRLPNGRVHTE